MRHRYVLILPRTDQVTERPYHQQWQMLSSLKTLSQSVAMMACFNAEAYERYYAADPCLDHLLTLSKFNVLRAFLDNLAALGLSFQDIEDDAAISPFNSTTKVSISHDLCCYSERSIVPASLLPTATQRSVLHHPWLDCFPFPRMRDNLINAPEGFDDCELCADIMNPANGAIGIMVWGDPWLPQNWEVSESFLQKWSWVVEGCLEILVHSNYWRSRRGLERLEIRNR